MKYKLNRKIIAQRIENLFGEEAPKSTKIILRDLLAKKCKAQGCPNDCFHNRKYCLWHVDIPTPEPTDNLKEIERLPIYKRVSKREVDIREKINQLIERINILSKSL